MLFGKTYAGQHMAVVFESAASTLAVKKSLGHPASVYLSEQDRGPGKHLSNSVLVARV